MVESSSTQVSPISTQPTPREVVAAYLRLTVDTPDLQQARLHLTKRSVESGDFEIRAMPTGSTYTMGAEESDELGRRIPVNLKKPTIDGAAGEEMTVPMIVVEEEGQWKIDLPATMQRLMGNDAAATMLNQAMGAMGEALTTAMNAVGEVIAEGVEKVMAPAVKSMSGKPAKTVRSVKKVVKKAVKRVPRKVKKMAKKVSKKAPKKAAKKVAKKPAKKAKKAAKKSKR
jgi:hypothetical protein